MTGPYAIGIDVGATKIAAALVTRHGEVVAERRADTDAAQGSAAVIARIAAIAAELHAEADGAVAGVGMGTPGYVDRPAGIVRNAVNLGWREVALAHETAHALAQKTQTDVPVWIENDANVQALGEYIFGAAQGVDNFVHVSIGTGLGSGIMVHDELIAGATYTAAEMGHLSLDPDGRQCACGLRGCVETVVSGPGLVRTVQALREQYATTLPAGDNSLRAEAVVAAARQGDALARAALDETARWLGIAFAIYVSVLNPALIVVGGGLGNSAFDLLVPGARIELERRTLPQSHGQLRIAPSQVTSSAVGASALVWHSRPN